MERNATKIAYPLISIVTLNWNQTDVTCEFLESTKELTYPNYEILVCDMASVIDPSPKINETIYPKARLLKSEKNLGFTGGNNWGMKQAKGEYIFIVNNDTEVTSDLLDKLIQPFFDNPAIGVTCPRIKYFDNRNIIQYAGFNAINEYTGRTTAIGSLEEDKGQYNTSRPTNGAHGCAMLVSREVIEKAGRFPEKFFAYYEEWDWSVRIMKKGYTIWYVGDAVIYHKQSLSVGKNSPLRQYYLTRNRILYMRRNTNILQLSIFTLFFIFIVTPKSILYFARRKQFAHLKSFFRGVIWNLENSSYSPI